MDANRIVSPTPKGVCARAAGSMMSSCLAATLPQPDSEKPRQLGLRASPVLVIVIVLVVLGGVGVTFTILGMSTGTSVLVLVVDRVVVPEGV